MSDVEACCPMPHLLHATVDLYEGYILNLLCLYNDNVIFLTGFLSSDIDYISIILHKILHIQIIIKITHIPYW